MDKETAQEYRSSLVSVLKLTPDKADKRLLHQAYSKTSSYKTAREIIHPPKEVISPEMLTEQYEVAESEASQLEVPVIGALDILPFKPDLEMSFAQEDILWSHDVFDSYQQHPKSNNKERNAAKRFVNEAAQKILERPDLLESAIPVWKQGEGEFDVQVFHEIKKRIKRGIEEGKTQLSPSDLAQFIKVSVHNPGEVELFADEVLKSYFDQQTSREGKVTSMYDLNLAAYEVLHDQDALEKIVKIIYFDTGIVSREGAIFDALVITKSIDILNKELLIKAMLVEASASSLVQLVPNNEKEWTEKNSIAARNIDKPWAEALGRRIVKQYGVEKTQEKWDELRAYWDMGLRGILSFDSSPEDAESLSSAFPWVTGLLESSDAKADPLKQKIDSILPKATSIKVFNAMVDGFRRNGVEEGLVRFQIPTQDGKVIEAVVSALKAGEKLEDAERMVLDEYQKGLSAAYKSKGFNQQLPLFIIEGVCFIVRDKMQLPVEEHEISGIFNIGLPLPLRELGEESRAIAGSIDNSQRRFLNVRGVEVPVLNEQLKNIGYENVMFRKDPQDSTKTNLTIKARNRSFTVRLDKHFNFDLEGKGVEDFKMLDELRYIVLSLLQPVLCDERLQGPEGTGVEDIGQEVISRMGHLRFLPEGFHYTKLAVQNFFENEGRDLTTIDLERKNAFETTRNTTYVKPVVEKDEDLSPIRIMVPETLNFGGQNPQN